MKFIDFFAGIGGFRHGLELAGHKCVGFCEWDKYATASYTSMHLITNEQREYLSSLTLKQRQKEILKDEYRNGEWYANDIRNVDAGSLPESDCWCFGAPCQDFSIAGKRAGLDGDRSSLVREIFRLLEEQEEENRPEWIIYENVKGMFSSNRGLDYLSILSEMDRLWYDCEWQNINSKWFVPQNRERIYTIGHLRRFGRAKILPVTGTDGENSIRQIGMMQSERKNPNAYRVYDKDGISLTLGTMQGGGREPSVRIKIIGEINSSQDGQIHDISGIVKCHSSGHNNSPKIAIPVLTPDRVNKRQNGRRFKEDDEPMFTLTAQDRHGVAIGIDDTYGFDGTRIYEKCFPALRSERSGLKVGLSVDPITMYGIDSVQKDNLLALKIKEATKQGYALAQEGDSINLSVPESKTRRGRVGKSIAQTLDTSCNQGTLIILKTDNIPDVKDHDGIYVELPNGVICYAIWYEKYQCYITIRKLTPKECFRLQGWTDDYFDKVALVNSDSQLYKQAGNGVTVDVVKAIGEKIKEYEKQRISHHPRYDTAEQAGNRNKE